MVWGGVTASDLSGSVTLTTTFWSQPTDYMFLRNNKLGIKDKKTYLKCYIANPAAPTNPDMPFDETFSLKDSTTDKPRRVDLRFIEAGASSILLAAVSFMSLLL